MAIEKRKEDQSIRFWIPAADMTSLCFEHIKRHFRKKYLQMVLNIKNYGKERLSFGLSENLEPLVVEVKY